MACGRTAQPWRPVQRTRKAAVTVAKKRGFIPGRGMLWSQAKTPRTWVSVWVDSVAGTRTSSQRTVYPRKSQVTRESAGGGSIGRGSRVWAVLWFGDSNLSSVNTGACCCPTSCTLPGNLSGTSAVPLKLRENTRQELERERGREQ